MHLSEEQLNMIEKMAGLFFNPEQIAANIEIEDIELFCSEIELKIGKNYIAYMKGRLKTEMELRESVKMAALNGSNPAQTQMLNYFKQSEI